MLLLNNIEVKYQNVILVLRGVTIEVPEGQIVSLLGANGAGKSTTLKAISGMLYPEEGKVTDGSIEYNGVRIDGLRTKAIVDMGIVQIMEGRRTLEQLTVEENLVAGAIGRNPSRAEMRKDIDRVYEFFPRLKDVRNQTAGYLSGGEQQQLVVGRGLMSRPKLMLLDEASLGLAPMLVKEIYSIIERLNKEFKRRTKPMEIVAGERSCYTLLAFVCLKMEVHWRSKPIGKVAKNLPFFKELAENNFTQKN